MNSYNKKNIKTIIIVSLFLIGVGIIFLASSFNSTKSHIQKIQDNHVLGLTKLLDKKIMDYYTQCRKELKYIADTAYYNNAEAQWLKNGSSHPFYAVLSKNLLLDSGMLSHIYVLYPNDSRIGFPDPTRTYRFPFNDSNNDIRICVDEDDIYYLAFSYQSTHSDGLFIGLTTLEAFHDIVSENMISESHIISIYDPISKITMCNNISSSQFVLIENSLQNDPIISAQFYNSDEDTLAKSINIYDENNNLYRIRSTSLPINDQNSPRFRLCISIDESQYKFTFKTLSVHLLITYLFISVGIVLLLISLFTLNRRNATARKEIQLLQEKKRITDEIIARTNELEHFQRLETLGVMSSSIAHEFNNLLTPIMGYSLMSMDKVSDNEETLSDLNEIYSAAAKAQTLISSLCGYIHKKEQYTPIACSPDKILNDLVNMVNPTIPHGVTMEMILNCSQTNIYTDIIQTNQVYLNIIINAFQAMRETGGVLSISTYSENGCAVVCFKDTGPGISDEIKKHLFDIFYTTKCEKGTGLGLAIVKRILDMQEATITVNSAPLEGAEFIITYKKCP